MLDCYSNPDEQGRLLAKYRTAFPSLRTEGIADLFQLTHLPDNILCFGNETLVGATVPSASHGLIFPERASPTPVQDCSEIALSGNDHVAVVSAGKENSHLH